MDSMRFLSGRSNSEWSDLASDRNSALTAYDSARSDLDSWALSGFSSPYYKGDILQRSFDSGYVDTVNSEIQSAYDRMYNYYMTNRANEFTASESEKARLFNAEQAQLQRDYEERLSNTAYQRAFADMRAVGLNPYLAVSGGSASTPSGSAGLSSASGVGVAGSAYSHSSKSRSGFADLLRSVANIALSAYGLSRKLDYYSRVR